VKTVLGIDPSLSCTGLAIVSGGQLRDAGVVKGGDLRGAERLAHIYDGVTTWLQRLPHLDVSVAIEGYAFGAQNQREALGEAGGVIRLAVYRRGLPYVDLAPASWQSQLLGKPVEKLLRGVQLTQRYAELIGQTEFETFDALEAFAIALAGWQRAEGNYEPPARKPKRKVKFVGPSELMRQSAKVGKTSA
jgi:Holliday junction resolvasome RuvABC endonuclease subunit